MAEKRMFAKHITESDDFLNMSKDAQCLYYHLCMYADDDGFINNIKSIIRGVDSDIKYLEELKQNKYIHEFNSGIILIIHWKAHNYIQKDRYKPTIHIQERECVKLNDNSIYTLK